MANYSTMAFYICESLYFTSSPKRIYFWVNLSNFYWHHCLFQIPSEVHTPPFHSTEIDIADQMHLGWIPCLWDIHANSEIPPSHLCFTFQYSAICCVTETEKGLTPSKEMPVYHFRCFATKAVKQWHHQDVWKKCTWDLQSDSSLPPFL